MNEFIIIINHPRKKSKYITKPKYLCLCAKNMYAVEFYILLKDMIKNNFQFHIKKKSVSFFV